MGSLLKALSFIPWIIVVLLVGYFLSKIVRIIPNNRVGIVEKWRSRKGSLKEQIIALNGEAGYQPDVLRGGIFFLPPWSYKIHKVSLITVGQGEIAYIFARDGKSLDPSQAMGKVIVECNNFQDARAFLENGGQKGQQRAILREGTYAINLAQFVVLTADRIHYLPTGEDKELATFTRMAELIRSRDGFIPVTILGKDDLQGEVTIHDGPSLVGEEIIAPTVGDDPKYPETYHNKFQDPEKFLAAGGFRGKQLQVITDGTYYINRLFATVEFKPKTIVGEDEVGVVVSYFGPKGTDVSGDEYLHGSLVEKGNAGVQYEPLSAGKYPFNTSAGKVVKVPTTNVILKWRSGETGKHRYDEHLKEVRLITKDAFEPCLPLSVVLHIAAKDAPYVIQRFGSIEKLVNDTLDPIISAYFKNIAQTKTMTELLQDRSEIQKTVTEGMKESFAKYNLSLEEVLMDTPYDPEDNGKIEAILAQLRDREIAREQFKTYKEQTLAAEKLRELKEADAVANQQEMLTNSKINIEISSNQGEAALQKAIKDAEQIRVTASAEAEKEAMIGVGKATAIEAQVNAFGGPQFKVMQDVGTAFANAIGGAGIPIVPSTQVIMGGNEGKSISPIEAFFGLLTTEKIQEFASNNRDESEKIASMKASLKQKIDDAAAEASKKETSKGTTGNSHETSAEVDESLEIQADASEGQIKD